jgi:hypothetical protein
MTSKNRVTAVDSDPDKDGDNTMQVTLANGATIDVAIDLGAAQLLVQILQQRLVRWAHESAKNLTFPQLETTHVDVSHAGPGAQLMVSNAQTGRWVLVMSDEMLRKAKQELDRVLTWRFGPQVKQ